MQLFKTYEGRILISILWGLGLASIFKKVCSGKNCVIYKAPNPEDIQDKIYGHNDKCYKYDIHNMNCVDGAIGALI